MSVQVKDGASILTTDVTDVPAEPDVNTACGSNTNPHRFDYVLPASYKDGAPHTITVTALGVDTSGNQNGNNPILPESIAGARTIICNTCSAAPAQVTGLQPPPAPACGSTSVTFTWNAVGGANAANNYWLAINDQSTSWDPFNCNANGDTCIYNSTTSYTRTVVPGRTYDWTVAAINNCGWGPVSTTQFFTVPVCTGTITARSVLAPSSLENYCINVWNNRSNWSAGVPSVFSFSGGPVPLPAPQTQNNSNPVSWVNIKSGSPAYSISVSPPSGYGPPLYCYEDNVPGVSSGSVTTLDPGETIEWVIGLAQVDSWFSAHGGNVHTEGTYDIELPVDTYFLTKDLLQTPSSGIATYQSSAGSTNFGQGVVSENGYLVGQASTSTLPASLYDYYYSRFTNKANIEAATITAPPSGATPVDGVETYIRSGLTQAQKNLRIGPENWDITSDFKKVIFVEGTLTIDLNTNDYIRVQEGGFLAFIVKGGITIEDAVGDQSGFITTPVNRITDPHLTGFFITDATFATINNSTPTQLVAAGAYVAQSFSLARSLGSDNLTYPGELFVYRPDLWVNAPAQFKEIDISWQEVAP